MPLTPEAMAAITAGRSVANEHPEWAEDRGPFGRLLTTFGRPGFAIRNVLAGDPIGAAQQASTFLNQAAMAIPSGGLSMLDERFTPMGAASWASEKLGGPKLMGGLDTEREASDVLQTWGVDTKSWSPWARFGVDVVGGALTDPLTFVGGLPSALKRGAVPLNRGLARGAFATALEGTEEGARQLGDKALIEAEKLVARMSRRAPGPGARFGGELTATGRIPSGKGFNIPQGSQRAAARAILAGDEAELARLGYTPRREIDVQSLRELVRRRGAEAVVQGQFPKPGRYDPQFPNVLANVARYKPLVERAADKLAGKGAIRRAGIRASLPWPFTSRFVDVALTEKQGSALAAISPWNRKLIPTLLGGLVGDELGAVAGRLAAEWKHIDEPLAKGLSTIQRYMDRFATKDAGLRSALQSTWRGTHAQIARHAREGEELFSPKDGSLPHISYADQSPLADAIDNVLLGRNTRWAEESKPIQRELKALRGQMKSLREGVLDQEWPELTLAGGQTIPDPSATKRRMGREWTFKEATDQYKQWSQEAGDQQALFHKLLTEVEDFETALPQIKTEARRLLDGVAPGRFDALALGRVVDPQNKRDRLDTIYDWYFSTRRRELQDQIHLADRQMRNAIGSSDTVMPRDTRFQQRPRPLQVGDVVRSPYSSIDVDPNKSVVADYWRVTDVNPRSSRPITALPLETDPTAGHKRWRTAQRKIRDAKGRVYAVEDMEPTTIDWDQAAPRKGDRILGFADDPSGPLRSPYRLSEMMYVQRRPHPEIGAMVTRIGKRRKDKNLTDVLDERTWSGLSRRDWKRKRKLGPTEDYESTIYEILASDPEGQKLLQNPVFAMKQVVDQNGDKVWRKADNGVSLGLRVRGLGDLSVQRHRDHQLYRMEQNLRTIPQNFPSRTEGEQVQAHVSRLVRQGQANIPYGARLAGQGAKSLLAYVWPAYYFRNYLGMLPQSILDEEANPVRALGRWVSIGGESIPAFARNALDLFQQKVLGKDPLPARSPYFLNRTNLLGAARAGSKDALDKLKKLKVGRYRGDQVLGLAEGTLLDQNVMYREDLEATFGSKAVREAKEASEKSIGSTLGKWLKQALHMVRNRGAEVSNFFEDRIRLGMFAELLDQGIEPGEAVRRVQRAYVDYDIQSVQDDWLRTVVPFIRFDVVTAPNVLRQLHRPMIRQPVQAARRESERQDQGFGPPMARRGLAFPDPFTPEGGRSLAGLGTVQEATDAVARQAIPIPGKPYQPDFRHALARLTPVGLRPALEYGFDRSAYTGGANAAPRRLPPGPMSSFLQAIPGATLTDKKGNVYTRPRAERAIESLGLGRAYGMARTASTQGKGEAFLRFLTGLRRPLSQPSLEEQRLMTAHFEEIQRTSGEIRTFTQPYLTGAADPELKEKNRQLQWLVRHNKRFR